MPTNMMVGSDPAAPEQVPAAEPVAEAALAAPPPEAAPLKERSSERFAALARKEAEVYRRAQAVKQQQAEFVRQMEAQRAEMMRQAEEIKAYQSAKQAAALNPLDALKQLGLTYEQITEYVLNDNKPTPTAEVQSVRQELEAFKKQAREEQEKLVRAQRDQIAREQQQIVENFREEVSEYVSQHSDAYELTNLYGGASLVFDVINEHFNQTQKLLSIPEAAKLVEEHYEDLAKKAQATKKFAASTQKAASPQEVPAAPAPKPGPTLSNSLTAMPAGKAQSPRTDAERIAAALARLEGR